MGTTSKVCHVILRVWELICSVVVLGLVAHFVHILNDADVSNDSRIVYTLIVACISTLYCLLFLPPLHYAFLAFPADFCLFIVWMVAFGLLANRTGGDACGSYWYWNYWGYYWGGWWVYPNAVYAGPGDIRWTGCSQWRTVLAFSFIVSITYLLSFILGTIVITNHYKKDKYPTNGTHGPIASQPSRPRQPEVAQTGYHNPGYPTAAGGQPPANTVNV